MKYGFGVDLGGTTVKIAYFDETGNMLDKWEIPTVTAGGGKQILPDIAASVEAQVRENLWKLNAGAPKAPAKAADKAVAVDADDFNDED